MWTWRTWSLKTLKDTLTLVWTVNLTLSLSLRASEMSTCNVASVCRSTFTARGCRGRDDIP
ncbi:hypothetical protein EYF80_002543 [Liparis tanakae]|uniref:Uncharacterized protein n=1 Tax=Liparis tanakae TaxID=230148 RepID=A0A4Z2JDJ5_9TELE|nr:hypothetical protein EYF80_002543 [Liparis tanakae]